MNKINKLSPQLVAKIAAGEVVERPASVVKELIENSLDAGSTSLELYIQKAGRALIELRDNGSGMSLEDAELAFEQHTTSKISNEEDLSKIITLGFRGEALSSISAVADILLETGNLKDSTLVEILNQRQQIRPGKIEKGTTIKVQELFGRVPARKKFLRSDSTEFKHISDIFIRHALANLAVSFKLFADDKLVYNFPSTNSLETRIFDIWGGRYKDKLARITYDAPQIKITGLLSKPEEARRDRSAQFIFLNNRPISSNLITKAVEDAFHSTHPERRYPAFFIFLELDPESVDVNVHPRKLEVKFGNTNSVFSAVKHAVEHALSSSMKDTVKQQFSQQPNMNYSPQGLHSRLSERRRSYRPSSPNNTPNFIQGSLNFSRALLESDENIKKDTLKFDSFKAAQFFNTYIVIEREEKLLFIDQHAADERINYEKIMKKINSDKALETQALLTPETIELTPAEFNSLKEKMPEFEKLGIILEPFGKNTVKLAEKPAILKNFDFAGFIEEVLCEELLEINNKKVLHLIVATLACHSSIRAGRKMHQEEVETMIKQLFACEKPYSCPHGRPIIWELSKNELEKNFKRTGF
ncbi:DNA mismatch repair endonuclease MutL [Candidatus Dojkabacteria bacterium]|nr:DNA mismatch repair endonuclease MutL [Candidatus Dojkabacteria bacterium]